MFPTPRKSDGAMDTHAVETSTPSSEPRKRGRRQGSANDLLTPLTSIAAATPSPSAARRRGCNCKKSGCLKLYCECFAAGMRCGDRCQCLGCKNREHNKLEIAHAMETIEKRSQRSAKSPVVGGIGVAAARKQGPPPHPRGHGFAYTDTPPTHGLRTPVIDGATRLLLSAERLEETPRSVDPKAPVECICVRGVCHAACPCHVHFGGCSRRCACRQIPTTQEKTRGCSCKKSNCLKLYCECLAAQRQCDSRCNCEGCKNHTAFTYERERAIAAILERNPMAFEPKVATGASQHQRGCNCRKSNCMKNYCECHQAGVPCTGRCACQDCRNTDAFVSAKKMLIFSGDLKVRGPTTSPESSHVHALTPASAKPPRRPSRHASMDQTSPPSHLRTSTGQTPTALELLSRTAPPAPQQDPSFFHHGRTHPHAKRKQADGTLGDESVRDASTDAKRKFTKPHHSTSRLNFQERLDRAASSSTIDLPSVESVLDADVDAARPELPLSKLCRSLLHAASSVDVTPTPRKTESAAATTPTGISTVQDASTEDDFVEARGGGAMSPMTDDLLCEEDIETPTRGTSSTTAGDSTSRNGSKRSADADDKQRAADLRLAALQERAVLQEFSVWLRNLATL